ncbi:MAG: hypothetical protein GY702_25215 [Desulfobulbaceae bacterium]|nr:hypothetical protein [Desulfobulbaceae bacterium]
MSENGELKEVVIVPSPKKEEDVKGASVHDESELDDETDPCNQIKFLIDGLSRQDRRRTLLMLDPMFSSTFQEEKPTPSPDVKETSTSAAQTLYTSGGEYTLGSNSSVSKIIFQAPSNNPSKLRLFSGKKPVPKGEVDYRAWISAAKRLSLRKDLEEGEKCERIQNSLLDPALSLVRQALEASRTSKALSLLTKAYDDVKSVRDLQHEFRTAIQLDDEESSEYLTKIYLLLQEVNRKGAVDDFDAELLKQFIYGCTDEQLILKLRLEEKDDLCCPPEYGSLLLSIRTEEARKRAKRQFSSKRSARVQQLQQPSSPERSPTENKLQKEVEALRKEVAQLKQIQQTPTDQKRDTPQYGNGGKSANRRKTFQFCFQCGLDNHMVWNCNNPANPALVAKKFEMAKKQRQENQQGSR